MPVSAAPALAPIAATSPTFPEKPLATAPTVQQVATRTNTKSTEEAELLFVGLGHYLGLSGERAARINSLLPELPSIDIFAWYLAFDLLREWEDRKSFAALALKLNESLNIEPPSWDRDLAAAQTSLLAHPRILEKLQSLCRSGDKLLIRSFLVDLLTDNRGGTRNGFPEGVAVDMATLIGMVDIELAV